LYAVTTLAPAAFAIASVAAGVLLAAAPGAHARALGPVRTFALSAALSVVLLHLFPEAIEHLGGAAVLGFVLGLTAPAALERIGRGLARRGASGGAAGSSTALSRLGAEAGYAGLLLHHVGDGTALHLFGASDHPEPAVLFALAAHTIPVTALVVLRFGGRDGRRAGLLRAAGLALATLAGIGLASVLGPETWRPVEPWVAAVVSGLLLHFLAHDLEADLPRTTLARALDLAALTAGIGLTLAASRLHAHGHEAGTEPIIREGVLHALADLALETAPLLLLGLALGALVQTWGGRVPFPWLVGGGPLSQAARGIAVGVPLPVCDCGVLPVARSLIARGAGPALVVAFALATPETGIQAFALTARLFGLPFSIARIAGGVLVAMAAAWAVARLAAPASADPPARAGAALPLVPPDLAGAPFARRLAAGFDELMLHTAPWVLLGLIPAAYIEVLVERGDLAWLAASGLDVPVVMLAAIPSYVCSVSATPLAAVLLSKGLSTGAVLAGLILGPATNLATLAFFHRTYGARATAAGFAALAGTAWAIALAANRFIAVTPAPPLGAGTDHAHGIPGLVGSVILALLVLRSLWRLGARAWVASVVSGVGHAHGPSRERGAHAHAHDGLCCDDVHEHPLEPPRRPSLARTGARDGWRKPASLENLTVVEASKLEV